MSTAVSPDEVIRVDADEQVGEASNDTTRDLRRGLTTVLGAAAAPLLVLSNVLLPTLPNKAADVVVKAPPVVGQLIAAHLVYIVASLLFIPFTLALWRIPGRRGSVLRLVGGSLTIIGMLSNALGEATDGYLLWGVVRAHVDPAAQVRLLDLLDKSNVALPVSFLAIPVAVLGALLLTAGVLRAKVVPAWAPWTLIVGAVISAGAGVGVSALLGVVFAVGGAATVLFVAARQAPGALEHSVTSGAPR